MCDPAAAAKARQRGLTVLERQEQNERIAAEKEEARRPNAVRVRRQSAASRRRVLAAETNTNVTEQERYIKVIICSSRCDAAAEHDKSRCASARYLPRSPALSASSVPASQVSSEVDVRPTSTSSPTTR